MMNIAFDGMPLASQLTGVGHYTFELARSLAAAAPADSFVLISPLPISDLGTLPDNLTQLTLRRTALNRRWWSVGLPLSLSRSSFDLFHGTNYEIPFWSRRPSVVTIHDLSLLLHPEAHRPHLVRRARWRLPRMAKSASRIITPSESVKSEVCQTFRINPDKVVVTPEAPRSTFKRREGAEVFELRQRLGIGEDFILFVGTVEPRKNLHRLVEAFDQLLRTTSLSPQLVIAGGQGWLMDNFVSVIRQKKFEDRICLTGYLQDEELCALYSSCKAFVYPSQYEGFGLPPLEAMACGAPVITSRIPSISETVGTAARLVDPRDADELSKAIAEMLSDEQTRKHYTEAGFEQVKKFTWEQTAIKTLEVYRQVLSPRNNSRS
jgi:glycosyltransferase involved in cell wall biosynthesis